MKGLFIISSLMSIIFCDEILFAQYSLTDSLIAYYPFNGNANDESGNGNSGAVYGATLTDDRFGNGNSAYLFDGISNFLSLTAGPKFKPTTFPISVCAWVKANTVNAVSGLIFQNDFVANKYTGIFFEDQLQYGGTIAISYGDGGTTNPCCRRSKIGTIPINDDQWHFIAGVIRGPTDMDIYIDCNYDPGSYSGTGDSMIYLADSGMISKRDVVAGTYYYAGVVDDIRFYHRELSQIDLETLYYYPQPFGNSAITVSLGNDTVLCPGYSLQLIPAITGVAQSYLWSDGSTDSTLNIEHDGEYWVQVSDGCGIVSDTIIIGKGFLNPVNLGADTTVCNGQFLILDAGPSFDSYEWSNGAFTQSIIVNTSGIYSVTVTGNGCTSTDSILVNYVVCTPVSNLASLDQVHMQFDEESNSIVISNEQNFDFSTAQFVLYDIIGREILREKLYLSAQSTRIYLNKSFADGIYIASIEHQHRSINVPLAISY